MALINTVIVPTILAANKDQFNTFVAAYQGFVVTYWRHQPFVVEVNQFHKTTGALTVQFQLNGFGHLRIGFPDQIKFHTQKNPPL